MVIYVYSLSLTHTSLINIQFLLWMHPHMSVHMHACLKIIVCELEMMMMSRGGEVATSLWEKICMRVRDSREDPFPYYTLGSSPFEGYWTPQVSCGGYIP